VPVRKRKNANSTRHATSVAKLLQLVEGLVIELESGLQAIPQAEEQRERWRYIFGEKENVVSILVKLTGILVKIIPMEHEIMSIINKSAEKKVKDLSSEDIEIIKRYLKKVKYKQEVGDKKNSGSETDAKKEA
jgi:hypothetical protein